LICAAVLATACALTFRLALAEERGPIAQDVQLSLGAFFLTTGSQIRLDGATTGTGTQIDWEKEFSFDNRDQFRLDGFWRVANKHKVRFMYFENNRSNSSVLSRDIHFGDQVFPVDLKVDAELNTRIIELAYEYAFMRRDNMELSGSIGIHNMRLEAGLRGDLSVSEGGGAPHVVSVKEVGVADGPLPVLGVHFLWDMGHNFYFVGLAQYFVASVDNYDGHVEDYKAAVTWMPWQNVGLGVAYNRFATRLNVQNNSFDGQLKLTYDGPVAYITVGF
jgi:hypothetical protein